MIKTGKIEKEAWFRDAKLVTVKAVEPTAASTPSVVGGTKMPPSTKPDPSFRFSVRNPSANFSSHCIPRSGSMLFDRKKKLPTPISTAGEFNS